MQTYTHRDLAGLLGVSETTIKSYRSKFPGFLPLAREGKPVRLHQESLEVCLRIRDLFAEGLTIAQATESLRHEFKEYPHNRRLSIFTSKAAVTAAAHEPDPGPDTRTGSRLDARLEALAQSQELARARMEQLEAEVRNLATMEAASKALVAELIQELRASRLAAPSRPDASGPDASGPDASMPEARQPETRQPEPNHEARQPEAHLSEAPAGPTMVTARKIVTVHGQAGPVASYALGREPRPQPLFDAPAQPGEDFLALPAVIRSGRGDFLGLPGGQSVARLLEVLTPQDGAPAVWFEDGPEAWTCELALGPALTRELSFERTTTPRGNLVGLIRRLRTRSGASVAEALPAEVQELVRLVRDQLG
ncbi:MAG: MerR family transcriptional regulator [Humidesulfovibrio sp.]|nr:MerR family transcriptional regulator [Humidesulfovibrio sp.]